MRAFDIVVLAALAGGLACSHVYAATSADDDGVTVVQPGDPLTAPGPTAPAVNALEQIKLSDGDVITAPAGSTIITRMDPASGDFQTTVQPTP